MNQNLQNIQAEFKKAEKPDIKLPTIIESWIDQGNSRNISTSASFTMPLNVWITTNWKILHETGVPDHLTCLLRNLYASQEASVRSLHGTTDWFKIGKGVRQGYKWSFCLFNLYEEYIM